MKTRYPLWSALAVLVMLSGTAAAEEPRDRRQPSEEAQKPKRETPYSNRVVQERREIVRAIREAEQQERRKGYRFRDRRPE